MSKAVRPDGTPTGAKDERGVLVDLTSRDVEALAKAGGDPAAYLDERRRQVAEYEERQREEARKERYLAEFIAAGGTSKAEGEKAWTAHKNQLAAEAAHRADQVATLAARQRMQARL